VELLLLLLLVVVERGLDGQATALLWMVHDEKDELGRMPL
jgi:hypothetical protein